jgi:hypothetical protein
MMAKHLGQIILKTSDACLGRRLTMPIILKTRDTS